MKIIYEQEPIEDKPSLIGSVSVGDSGGKIARIYFGKDHAKDSGKVSKIFDVLIEAKQRIEAILNANS